MFIVDLNYLTNVPIITYITSDGKRSYIEDEAILEWATAFVEVFAFVCSSVGDPTFEYVFKLEFETNKD